MKTRIPKLFSIALILALMVSLLPAQTQNSQAFAATVTISQVYGGGGNTGATLKNDFIELYNYGSSAMNITGWSVQYGSATGTSFSGITVLSGTIEPGHYYLIQEAQGAGGTVDLPTPNAFGTITMSANNGKVALVIGETLLTETCPTAVIDLVGYGTANCSETAPTAALTNTTAALRNGDGATDTDNNSADFTIGPPNPRNTPPPDTAPTVISTYPIDGATDFSTFGNLSVTFSEPVTVSESSFGLTCSTSGMHTAAVSSGPVTFTLNPDTDFVGDETCTWTIIGAQVADQDGELPYDTMAADYVVGFTAVDVCDLPFTPIYDIQGSGPAAAITGTLTTKGVVVGDYELPTGTGQLRGYYLQDPNGDANAATSDGIFVYNSGRDNVNVGDLVRVTGTASDYQDQTQISAPAGGTIVCGTDTVNSTPIVFPISAVGALEPFEGMLVRVEQSMYVTEHFQLGRFGQVTLSSDVRLSQPTNVVAPGAPALALQAQNNLKRIILDDANNLENVDPIVFARGGSPLSASNTLRGGDYASGIVGVMTYTYSGNAASGNAWRIRPINAMGGNVNFEVGNERPTDPPDVGGTVKVVGMNLLNYFNTFVECTNGVGGTAADCRGASNVTEFERQWTKTVAAIVKMDADVIGLTELENDGYGAESAIAHLVDKLNIATAAGTYAFIDADTVENGVNSLGVDGIKVGMIYKPTTLKPVGQTSVLNSVAFVNGGDAVARNRPTLAQAFELTNGARFIVDVNHLKSKGSACTTPDALDGQGNCNVVRVAAATELVNWLATNPTGTGDPDILLVGDYNAYAMEDPITTIKTAGYNNLIDSLLGPDAYSYVFDGQWGYLDHALASASLASQVTGVGEYHINADEPSILDYLEDFKSASQLISLYAPNEFRISDHDPVIVGLDLIPGAPNVLYPTNNTTKVNPTFKWTTVVGAVSYDLVVFNSLNVAVLDQIIPSSACGTSQCVYAPTTTLLNLANGSYTWQVRAYMGNDIATDWGDATFTKVAPPAPKFPAISSTTPSPKFIWTKVANQTRYQIMLYTSAGVVKMNKTIYVPSCTTTTCSYTPNPALALANGAYKWKIRAGDVVEWGAYSTMKIFNKVAPPAPISPTGTITLTNPKFTWKKIPGATKYYLRLETSTGTLKRQVEITAPVCTATTCSYTPNPVLNLAKGIYKWKVRAFNGYYGPYSGYLTFTKN